jgi:hypothetical protein
MHEVPLRGSKVGMSCTVGTNRTVGLIVYSLTNSGTEMYIGEILVLSFNVNYEEHVLFQRGIATVHTLSNTVGFFNTVNTVR